MRSTRLLTAGLAALLLAAGPASAHGYKAGSIEIGHPWSRAMPPGARTGAGYLTLENKGAEADRLVSASSPAAADVSVHEMSMTDGVMTMRAIEGGLAIPAGGETTLAPGGLHLMLTGVKEPFREGQMVPLTLVFEKAGRVDVELKVDAMGARGTKVEDHSAHGR